MMGLTPQQAKGLAFIRKFKRKHRYAPSFDEMLDGLRLSSKNQVHRIVTGLEERGAIRCLRLPDGRMKIRAIEILGRGP